MTSWGKAVLSGVYDRLDLTTPKMLEQIFKQALSLYKTADFEL